MQVISSKVLVDIPLFGKPTGKEKIIFQRKKDFSLESIVLVLKKLFIGKQMKQVAADRIQMLCQNYGYKEESIQELDRHINATNSVDAGKVVKTFAALSKENRRTLFLEEKDNLNLLNLPVELNELISNRLASEAKAEYNYFLTNSNFKKETLLDVLSLAKNVDGSENDEINAYIINQFYPDQTISKTPEESAKLNKAASRMILDLANKIGDKTNYDDSFYPVLVKACINEVANKLIISNKNNPIKKLF